MSMKPAIKGAITVQGFLSLDLVMAMGDDLGKLSDQVTRVWGEAQTRWRALTPDTPLTQDQWVIPLLQSLGYSLAPLTETKVHGQSFPISHQAAGVPVHIVGDGVDLDRRPPKGGLSPQTLVQTYLDCTDPLWGVVTNGQLWRLVRSSGCLSGSRYLQVDLRQILTEGDLAEFGLFYRLFHRSQLPLSSGPGGSLEALYQESVHQGGRAREKLGEGVVEALKILGNGFLQHPQNRTLKEHLSQGGLTPQEYYGQLLQVVYRLLFLLVMEAQGLLPADHPQAPIYRRYYSLERLRGQAERPSPRPENFSDLWQGLRVTFALFDERQRGQLLGLPPLNSDLFRSGTLEELQELDNHFLRRAIRALGVFDQDQQPRRINYAALAAEELGSIYQRLLDLYPVLDQQEWVFELIAAPEVQTKSPAYYTPPELVKQIVKDTLEPVLAEKLAAGREPEEAVLDLKVCDPACGSGQFLLAAARYLGQKLAEAREADPSPLTLRQAVRTVISQCIYGVDLNPLAVDLTRLALGIEGFCPGLSMMFLDHRIKCGNSLVGVVDLGCLEQGIPDEAYKPGNADDRHVATQMREANKGAYRERRLLPDLGPGRLAHRQALLNLGDLKDDQPAAVHHKHQQYIQGRQLGLRDYQACNLWVGAFFIPLTRTYTDRVPTWTHLERFLRGQPLDPALQELVEQTALREQFFHWPLEYPEVFGERGGFDCVVSTPPWESLQVREFGFFAARDPAVRQAQTKEEQQELIRLMPTRNPALEAQFGQVKRSEEAQNKFIRSSGRFRHTKSGQLNTYTLFLETAQRITRGRATLLVPGSILGEARAQEWLGTQLSNQHLLSLGGFDAQSSLLDSSLAPDGFGILTLTHQSTPPDLVFHCQTLKDLKDERRHHSYTIKELHQISPNTLSLPQARTDRDAQLLKKIYTRAPVLVNETRGHNPWQVDLVNLKGEAGSKLISRQAVEQQLGERWQRDWLMVLQRVIPNPRERTVHLRVAAKGGLDDQIALVLLETKSYPIQALFLANLNSLVLDFVAGQKLVGTALTFPFLQQLPVLPPKSYQSGHQAFILPRVIELTYTTFDLKPFAQDLGYSGPPFPWDPQRQARLSSELDAYYAHLYGLSWDDLRYLLDPREVYGPDFPGETFPLLQEREIQQLGEYRTRRLILEAWDQLGF